MANGVSNVDVKNSNSDHSRNSAMSPQTLKEPASSEDLELQGSHYDVEGITVTNDLRQSFHDVNGDEAQLVSDKNNAWPIPN